MLVVAVLAVIAAIAIPLYQEHILRAKRNACEAVMVATSGVLERRHSAANTYVKPGITDPNDQDHLPGDTAEDRPTCPEKGPKAYDLSISGVTESTWTLIATPFQAQAADKCGLLAINSQGQKFASGPMTEGSPPAIDFTQDPGSCW
jgi:type IV pilus assembly protein PilE